MAERSVSAPSLRLVWLSLMVLVALAAFSHSLHPLERGFGLAHARVLESHAPPLLVVDNLNRADVGSLQQIFSGKIWARHAFRVHEILLPSLALAISVAVLSRYLALGLGMAMSQAARFQSSLVAPPLIMWVWLVFGSLVGLMFGADWRFSTQAALTPFVLAVLAVAGASLRSRPSAQRLARALAFLSASRWFWLGFLALSWLDPWSRRPAQEFISKPFYEPATIGVIAVGFLMLHWATRAPSQINLLMLEGDRRGLVQACERLTFVMIQELWFLLPLLAWFETRFPEAHLLGRLSPYLFTSVVCGLLMKWTLEGQPPRVQGWMARLTGSLCRATTMALILSLPIFFYSHALFELTNFPVTASLILIGLGLVRGQPWRSQKKACDFTDTEAVALRLQMQPSSPPNPRARARWSKRSVLAALAAAVALLVAIGSSASADWSRTPLALDSGDNVRSSLKDAFGYRVRYISTQGGSLLLGQALNPWERAQAERIVGAQLHGKPVSYVGVHLWRWEMVGMAFLLLTLGGAIVSVPMVLLGLVSVSRPAYVLFFTALAGANGAFALGANWGWFWLDPLTHAVAFALCTLMSGAGLGWVRQRIVARRMATEIDVPSSPEPVAAAPETTARKPESIAQLIKVDEISLEVGRGLLSLVDPREGAKLLERVTHIRRHIAMELGLILPGVRFRDNLQLKPNTYIIKVRDIEVAQGDLEIGRFLAIGPEDKLKHLPGNRVVDPTFGMPGVWVEPDFRAAAEHAGCIIFDPLSVVGTQLTEVCRQHLPALVTLESMSQLMNSVAKDLPVTVAMVRERHSLLTLRDVYRGLLEERVSVRDHEMILNRLAGCDGPLDTLIEECRHELRAAICREYQNDQGTIGVIALDAELERELLQGLRSDGWPESRYRDSLECTIEPLSEKGLQHPIMLVPQRIRAPFRKMARSLGYTNLIVLGSGEIAPQIKLHVVATLGRTVTQPGSSKQA